MAILILVSGVRIFKSAIFELTDASVSSATLLTYTTLLDPLLSSSNSADSVQIFDYIETIRAVRSGSAVFIDISLHLKSSKSLEVSELMDLIQKVKAKIRTARKEVKEVRVEAVLST